MLNRAQTLLWYAMGLGPIWQRRQLTSTSKEIDAATSVIENIVDNSVPNNRFDETEDAHKADILFIGDGFDKFDAELAQQDGLLLEKATLLYQQIARAVQQSSGTSTHLVHIRRFHDKVHHDQNSQALNEERLACLAHLHKQIEVVQPRVVIALGASIGVILLNQSESEILSGAANQALTYGGRPLIITTHPRQILAQPILKRQVWRDLCLALKLFYDDNALTQMERPTSINVA